MITAIVKAVILKNKHDDLRVIADTPEKEFAPNEDGCLQYESFIDGDTFITIERWRDQASLDIHPEQDHVKKYVPLMKECIEHGQFDVHFINGGEHSSVKI